MDTKIVHIYMNRLEIPASQVFLGADTQLLGTSLAGARMPLVYILIHYLNCIYVAQLRLAQYHASGTKCTDLWPLMAT